MNANWLTEEATDMSKKPSLVKMHDVHLDSDYIQWLHNIKERYRNTQIKAAVKVNSEQLLFNWQLGRDLVLRRAEDTWGAGVVEQVSLDLQAEFPNVKGFSTTNLWNMKKWYAFYSRHSHNKNLQQLVGEIEYRDNNEKQKELSEVQGTLQQDVGELPFPDAFGFVPWGHHVEIVTKCKSIEEALFYVKKIAEEAWSRSALQNYIAADLYHNAGAAITNFSERLPATQSKLAQEITKDTYDLGFITLPADYDESALESALEQNITRFLLELGTGFSFVGRQKEIIVSGKTRRIDMLFYHIKLRCYVVVELKAVAFEPEFAGKLNFYVNAVNDLMKTDTDNPTIGLLICKDKDQTEVQWAFQGITTPMGVASYSNVQIQDIKAQLPTAEEIQKRIEQAEEEFRLNSAR